MSQIDVALNLPIRIRSSLCQGIETDLYELNMQNVVRSARCDFVIFKILEV